MVEVRVAWRNRIRTCCAPFRHACFARALLHQIARVVCEWERPCLEANAQIRQLMRSPKRFVMYLRRTVTVLTVFVAGTLVGAAVPVFSEPAGAKVTKLLTAALSTEFTPDREVLIDLVEI